MCSALTSALKSPNPPPADNFSIHLFCPIICPAGLLAFPFTVQMKWFVPFCGAAYLFLLERIFNCFVGTVFTPYTEQPRFPQCFLTGCAWCVCVAVVISGCGTKTRSIALLGPEPAAGLCRNRLCFLLYATNTVAVHIIPFNTQSDACLQLPGQLLQVAWLSSLPFLGVCCF